MIVEKIEVPEVFEQVPFFQDGAAIAAGGSHIFREEIEERAGSLNFFLRRLGAGGMVQ